MGATFIPYMGSLGKGVVLAELGIKGAASDFFAANLEGNYRPPAQFRGESFGERELTGMSNKYLASLVHVRL